MNVVLTDSEPMETQLDNIRNKAHVLETLGYPIPDALLAVIIINRLPESYEVLKTKRR